MTLNRNAILIAIASIIFFVVFLMGYGVIFEKQPGDELLGLVGLGSFFFALGHL